LSACGALQRYYIHELFVCAGPDTILILKSILI